MGKYWENAGNEWENNHANVIFPVIWEIFPAIPSPMGKLFIN